MISDTYYGDVDEATAYFANRLHAEAWANADASDYPKALLRATQIIDALSYKGCKAPVYQLYQQFPDAMVYDWLAYWPVPNGPTMAQVWAADASQELEFPRGTDTSVPEAIRRACYEIAYALLDGKDPELELENLAVTSQSYSSVRTTYNRNQAPLEHIANGIPSAEAWRILRPFVRDDARIKVSRVS